MGGRLKRSTIANERTRRWLPARIRFRRTTPAGSPDLFTEGRDDLSLGRCVDPLRAGWAGGPLIVPPSRNPAGGAADHNTI